MEISKSFMNKRKWERWERNRSVYRDCFVVKWERQNMLLGLVRETLW